VTSKGEVVPSIVAGVFGQEESEVFPARIYRVGKKPGKWTDIWIDKTAKVLTRGILIETSSRDFTRKVEIRGSDTAREEFIIRLDGLIADIASPLPLRSLSVFHPLNNFQYVHIRILDDDKPPLKVDAVSCYPPTAVEAFLRSIPVRITENRTDPKTGSTVVVADLGEKRFPLTSLTITSPAKEFVKKAVLSGGSSPDSASWKNLAETTLFKMRKQEAVGENLKLGLKPDPCRYVMLDISGPHSPPVAVSNVQAGASISVAVFQYKPGVTYSLFYNNPEAKHAEPSSAPSSMNLAQVMSASSEISLGPDRKNVVQTAPKPQAKQDEATAVSAFRRAAGIAMLLAGLLLLFSLMLRARSSRKGYRKRNSKPVNTRI